MVEIELFYREYKEKTKINMIEGQKQSMISPISQLAHHNSEIYWKTEEVKMTRCLDECGKQWNIKQTKLLQQPLVIMTLQFAYFSKALIWLSSSGDYKWSVLQQCIYCASCPKGHMSTSCLLCSDCVSCPNVYVLTMWQQCGVHAP